MIDPLQTVLTVLSLALALVAVVMVALDRRLDRFFTVGFGVLFVGLLVQCVVGIGQLVGTDRDVSGATFVGYLVGLLLVPPAALAWARLEPTRWGTAVFIVAGLLVPVLILRLEQIWTPGAA